MKDNKGHCCIHWFKRTLTKSQPPMILEMSLQAISPAAQWHSCQRTCSWHHSPLWRQAKLFKKDTPCCHFCLHFGLCRSPLSKPQVKYEKKAKPLTCSDYDRSWERLCKASTLKAPTRAPWRKPRFAFISVHHQRAQIMQLFSIYIQVPLFHTLQNVLPLPLVFHLYGPKLHSMSFMVVIK